MKKNERKGGFAMLTRFRRELHRIPELDRALEKTAAYLRAVLEPLGCRVFSPTEGSVCAFFDFGFAEAVAFRADMDALPVAEATGLPFASAHSGKMHACGHDGHMAILLGLAVKLAQGAVHPKRNVLLVFQPAEETTGGALALCQTGLFEAHNVTRVFGLHLWPDLPAGEIASASGGFFARSSEVTAEICGKSAHIARARQGCDALEAAAEFLLRAYALAENKPCVLRFGRLQSGTVRNALSAHSLLEGSLRCLDDALFDALRQSLFSLAAETDAKTGCQTRLRFSSGYPPVTNDAALLREARALYPVGEVGPSFTTDDFSEYQKRAPGVYFLLGTGGGAPLHSPQFNFDEAVLEKGLALFSALV